MLVILALLWLEELWGQESPQSSCASPPGVCSWEQEAFLKQGIR